MDPVYEEVSEDNEERKLDYVVERERRLGRGIVEFCITLHLSDEKWNGENGHEWKSIARLLDLESHLVLQIFWMRESGVVKDEEIG